MKRSIPCLAIVGVLVLAPVAETATYAYPAKGQSPATQAKDEGECSKWAIAKTGYDPANPPPIPKAQPAPVTGSGARVKGAVVGGAVGAVAGGDAGDAALAGAVAGGVIRRNRNRRAAAEQNQANAQQAQAAHAGWEQARGACMTGRGYTVK